MSSIELSSTTTIPAGNGKVFHAGPGVNMHWIDTNGDGSVTTIGPRGDDEFSINAGAVMFDTGKILKAGGSPGYEGMQANANSYVIELGATKLEADKAEFDARYRDTIDEWLI